MEVGGANVALYGSTDHIRGVDDVTGGLSGEPIDTAAHTGGRVVVDMCEEIAKIAH